MRAAGFAHASASLIDLLAGGFVASRLGYTAAYLGDRPGLRTLAWSLGIGCVVALFVVAASR